MKKYTFHLLYVSLFAALIFGFRYLPFQDYPVLLYQGFVFNEVVFHGNTFGGFFHFHPYLPPNAISTVVIGVMDIFIDPFITGKIYLLLLATGIYSGFYRYLTSHLNQRKNSFSAFSFFLTLNLHFLMGYLNFLTGLAVILHVIVIIREKKYETRFFPMALAFLIIYLCHFAAFALFSLYFFFYFISKKNYRGLIRMALSAVPAIIIFLHYLINRSIPILPLNEFYENIIVLLHWKALILFLPVIPFNTFKWIQEIPLILKVADIFFAFILLSLFLYVIVKMILRRNYPLEFFLAVSTFLLAICLPLDFGGVTPAGERVVAFCSINAFILLFRTLTNQSVRKIGFIICFFFGVVTYSYDIWNIELFDSMVAKNEIPKDAIIHENWKLEGTNGFLHLHFYDDIQQKKPYPFFDIGLFEYPNSK